MRLPEIAARLRELAQVHNIPELCDLADQMRRRPPRRRGLPVSARMTPALAAAIRKAVDAEPHVPLHEIARRFRVNQGRVSEAVRGKR